MYNARRNESTAESLSKLRQMKQKGSALKMKIMYSSSNQQMHSSQITKLFNQNSSHQHQQPSMYNHKKEKASAKRMMHTKKNLRIRAR